MAINSFNMTLARTWFSLLLIFVTSTAFAQPAAPSGLTANGPNNYQIVLNWTDNSTTETGFQVERSPNGTGSWTLITTTAANATTYTNTGLASNYTYWYRIRATDGTLFSTYSNIASATTVIGAPSAPSGLTATAASNTSINLAWVDNSSLESGYQIERSLTSGTGYSLITTTAANATTYTNTGLTANTKYYYRVRGTNAGGNSAYATETFATTFPNAPTAPSALSSTAASSSQINLSWTDNANNETGFQIERSATTGTGFTLITTTAANATSYSNTGLTGATQYFYRVRATNTGGNSAYTSETSSTTLSSAPSAPSALTSTTVNSGSIALSWTDNSSNETGFEIERSVTSGSGFALMTTTAANATSFTNSGLTAGTTYYYRIRAVASGVQSAYATQATATTTNPSQGAVPDAIEFQVLKNMFDSLGGAGWTSKTNWPTSGSWPSSAGNDVFGGWYGISVQSGDVVGISLANNNLTGYLPVSIGKLTSIGQLVINNNSIGGTLPSSLNKLTSLWSFYIAFNLFTGDLPNLNAIHGLVNFSAYSMPNLTGPFPAWLGDNHNLQFVQLEFSNRYGPIPANFVNMPQLAALDLSGNSLSGSIPDAICTFTNLLFVNFSNNQFTGTIPTNVGNLIHLQTFAASSNNLSGTIPAGFASITPMSDLRFDYNKLSGAIPSGIGSLPVLQFLFLNDNDFTSMSANLVSLINRGYVQFRLANNHFDFSVLEPLSTATPGTSVQLFLTPQKTIPYKTIQKFTSGSPFIVEACPAGSNSTVTWQKKQPNNTWTAINSMNSDGTFKTFSKSNFTGADAGTYRYTMTNTLYPSVTLQGDEITVTEGSSAAPGNVFNNLRLWLKADAGITGSTTASSWADQSGNGFVGNSSTSVQPTIAQSSINFNPSIQFNNNAAFNIAGGILKAPAYNDINIFTVAKGVQAQQGAIFNENVVPGQFTVSLPWNDAQIHWTMNWNGINGMVTTNYADLNNFSAWTFAGSAGVGALGRTTPGKAIYRNGLNIAIDNAMEPVTGANADMIVGGTYATGGYFHNGNIAELLIYTGKLTATDAQKINSYLAIKYGHTLDQTTATNYIGSAGNVIWDATAAGAFKSDIAVIARDDASALNQKQTASSAPGNILTIGNSSIGVSNQTNDNNFLSDNNSFAWAHNNLSTSISGVTDFAAPMLNRLARVWRAQENGSVGSLKIRFVITGISGVADKNPRLLVDVDGTFATGSTVVPPSSISGDVIEFDFDFTSSTGYYFTIGGSDTPAKTSAQVALDNWSFQYRYDGRRRVTGKKVPGSEWIYMIYDDRDRLVLTQDGNQRRENKWLFTKYDPLNRPVLTGIYKSTPMTRAEMQLAVDNFYQQPNSSFGETSDLSGDIVVHGYSNKSFPPVSDPEAYLSVTYYDNYDFSHADQQFGYGAGDIADQTINGITYAQAPSPTAFTTGLVTGSKIKVLSSENYWLRTVNYYDDKSRTIQTVSDHHRNGIQRTSSLYDFVGKVLSTTTSYGDSRIQWKDLVNSKVDGNTLIPISTTGQWGGAGAASVVTIAADGWTEATYIKTNSELIFGLSDTNPDAGIQNIDYGIYLPNEGQHLKIYENGAAKYESSSIPQIGSVYRVERTAGIITYKKDGITFYTSLVSSSGPLMLDVALNGSAILFNARILNSTSTSVVVKRSTSYDTQDRITDTYHQIGTAPAVWLTHNEYNELGQLVDKKLHLAGNVNTFKQSLDYRYNIRGWLTSVNTSDLSGLTSVNDDTNDLFGMNLAYNETTSTGNLPLFNGNISSMRWSYNQAKGSIKEQAYNYTYDPLNRIASASYLLNNAGWVNTSGQYNEGGYQYDQNGNLKHMDRKAKNGIASDAMVYQYGNDELRGNRLLSVDDGADRTTGFIDGNIVGNDFEYDLNGNMVIDRNKNISDISYNHLNLPSTVSKFNDRVTYTYDAAGRKLRQYVKDGAIEKSVDYLGELYYENEVLQFVNHDEGRAIITPASPEYQYHLKDHLGNVRVTFTTIDEVSVCTATDEPVNMNTEYPQFIDYDKARFVKTPIFDHTYNGQTAPTNGAVSQRLNGSDKEKIGMAQSLIVMPGDKVNLEVYVKYFVQAAPEHPDFAAFMGSIANGTSTAGTVIDGSGYLNASLSQLPAFAAILMKPAVNTTAPKAYLNWIVFRSDMVMDPNKSGFKRISIAANEDGSDIPHEYLHPDSEITIAEPGFIYIWLSNENDVPVEVYFDDFKVTHTQSPVVQQNDYYPFGLAFNSYQRENSLLNKYQFNDKELQTDLGLNLYDYIARQYDPATGRFLSVDPAAGLMRRYSPYSYAFDNPIRFTDPDGMVPGDFLNEKGQNIGNDGRNDGKVYVIKTTEKKFDSGVASAGISKDQAKQTEAYIKANSGKTEAFGEGNIANANSVEIEGSSTNRQAMTDEANRDNGTGGTSDANNREYGGETGVETNAFTPAAPGPVGDPSVDKEAHITLSNFGDDTKSDTHSHPSGTKTTITSAGETKSSSWRQAPSSEDVSNSGSKSNYVIGRGNKTVYIYNNSGVQATIPQKYFVTPKK